MPHLWTTLKWALLAAVAYVILLLLYGTLTDWRPSGTTALRPSGGQAAALNHAPDSLVTLTTWNVGYGGLGAESFFFYNRNDFFWTEPGTVRPRRPLAERYLAGQTLTLQSTLSDIFLLQEVDTAARRSHYLNQLAAARAARPDYAAHYAANFESNRVPLPVFQPWDHYGYVRGGLVSLSRYPVDTAERIQLPGEHPWPTRLFQLDRCALRQVIPTGRGPNLVVYNVHLSAYDADGGLRRQQMALLRERCLADYARGDYVVVGGDWNQLPPGFNWFSLNPTVERVQLPFAIAPDWMPPGWKYAYDPATATVRDSADPYEDGRTHRSVIDFFLLSPNLRLRTVRGLEQRFAYSDHQPVYAEVELTGGR